jgi:aryl-alcohol dehydrogenase-like predicted oxidoreductase
VRANPNVSTVITGASRVEQVAREPRALDVLAQDSALDPVVARIQAHSLSKEEWE